MPLNVGILGATGTVGQKFIECLQGHPWFVIHTLGASAQSAGKPYKDAVSWKLSSPIPANVQKMVVQTCEPQFFKDVHLVFSALDANVAGEVEVAFASAGIPVFSNARNHRYDDTVPILIPYVNAHQIDIIPHQKAVKKYPGNGYIVTNANCSSTGLVVALKPILDKFGIEQMIVFTMQAISGAGYPGVASLDIVDNVVPFISGEEPKMELEPGKILGGLNADKTAFVPAAFKTSAHCNRVCVVDGHMECVSIKLKTPDVTPEQVIQAINEFKSEAEELKLPSAPARPLVYLEQENRPQPRLDRGLDNGYSVTVGRVRKCPIFDIKLTLCSHNTVIGAAGGSILNAEVAVAKKLLPDPK